MKQIIIFLLLVIIGIMSYNFYQKWQRFHPPNYLYKTADLNDIVHSNKKLTLDYYRAVEQLNGYVITQWGAHQLDVRSPKDDDAQTIAAVGKYNDLLGTVKFYEAELLKDEKAAIPVAHISEEEKKKELVLKMFTANPTTLRLGEKGALVFEVQRLLNSKGASIKHDGLFRTETFTALQTFEAQNNLLPDGKLDAITLDYLLR